jgi:ABC-type oligopeptide transport system substrate-binding subunit
MEKKTEVIQSQSMYYLTFNLKNKDAVDINFRNAISAIIDRKLIIQTISKDLAVPTLNYTAVVDTYDNSSKVIFDASLNKDRGLNYLKNSTFKEGQKLHVVYESEKFDARISKEIAKNIEDYLDINVVCTGYKKEELKEVLAQGDYDIVFSKIDEEYGDAYKFFSRWTSNSTYNIYGYNNLEYDKIIQSALMENNNKNRIKIYMQAQELLAKDLPSIPVYIGNTVICKKENIKDIYTTRGGNLIFDYAYKDAGLELDTD